MDIFKTKQGSSRVYYITDDYINITGKKYPYCKKGSKGECFYAVCPACDNPIQIIGLYKNTKEAGRKPYGRHNKGSLSFAAYNEDDYLGCPYSKPTWSAKSRMRKPDSPLGQKIFDIIINQFDRIIYILSKDIDMKISAYTAERMLQNFIVDKGWLYRSINLLNLPWIFAEAQPAFPLFGRFIKVDSDLYRVLKNKCSEIILYQDNPEQEYAQVRTSKNCFCNLYYLLCNHKANVLTDDSLYETIDLWVYRAPVPTPKTIYRKTIRIRSDYFQNLINSTRDTVSRNEKLLDIAQNIKNNLI